MGVRMRLTKIFHDAPAAQRSTMHINEHGFQTPSLADWAKAAAKSAPGGRLDALNWMTPDGIAVKPLYTAADLHGSTLR